MSTPRLHVVVDEGIQENGHKQRQVAIPVYLADVTTDPPTPYKAGTSATAASLATATVSYPDIIRLAKSEAKTFAELLALIAPATRLTSVNIIVRSTLKGGGSAIFKKDSSAPAFSLLEGESVGFTADSNGAINFALDLSASITGGPADETDILVSFMGSTP